MLHPLDKRTVGHLAVRAVDRGTEESKRRSSNDSLDRGRLIGEELVRELELAGFRIERVL